MIYVELEIIFNNYRFWILRLENWLTNFWAQLEKRRRGVFSSSTNLSLMVRPWLEKDRVSTWLSAPIFAAMMAVGVLQAPMEAEGVGESWNSEEPIQTVLLYELKTPDGTTTPTYLLPVQVLTGVSQQYHQGHPGYDFRSPLGLPVIAMSSGKVMAIAESNFGYGRHVYIDHGEGLVSLYAHLGLIKVAEGESIDSGEIIGTIGLTGWSTGPHLHFEIRQNGNRVNPANYIGRTLEMAKQKATE